MKGLIELGWFDEPQEDRMDATKHRLQSNDENWHQIWKEDGEGRDLPYCEIVNTDKETVAEVFRAVNTFDQAREALKACREELNTRIEEDGDCDHSVGICVCGLKRLIEDVDVITSAMEATYE